MARWFVDHAEQVGIPSVSLRRLLPEAQFVGCADLEVAGCSADSRWLDPGQIFIAVRGRRRDGHDFIGRALDRGASGVVVEQYRAEAGRPQVVVPNSRSALARVCQALAGDPTRHIPVVGVTGTVGATAAGLFLRAMIEANGRRCGWAGTLGWSDGVEQHPAGVSTPRPAVLAEMLAEMVERDCAEAVVEISSQALERRDVDGMTFDAAVVTDLGLDRNDQPLDARALCRAHAARLFRAISPLGMAVVNADDPDTELLGAVNLQAERISFGLERPADVTAEIERLDRNGSRLRIHGLGREATVSLRLVGRRHLHSALAAVALAWARDMPTEAVVAGLEAVTEVPGRLERIHAHQGFDVYLDQSQTATELSLALDALRESGTGRLICVLGSEGHRDRLERLALGRVAEAGADTVLLTTDSPRTEDPDQIFDDLLAGFRSPGRVRVLPDRRAAIATALGMAEPGTAVLIAGRGRQTFQIFADRAVPFDDGAVARDWIRSSTMTIRRSA